MERWLGRGSEVFYALLRFVAGLMFAFHGAQKLFGLFGGQKVVGNHLLTAAGVIELVGGLMIALGIYASWAAFVAAGEMAYAYFVVHSPKGPWPIQNGGELAALYGLLFLYVASRGSGRIALVPARGGRRR
jgi:putative oxidoreductase